MRETLTTLRLIRVMLSPVAAAEAADEKAVRSFPKAHCIDCHGPKDPEGKVSLH